ncbi:MAG: hypothetical protein KDB61_02305 [Planctomycetes bacterium]|nr:hypothetical protein [Planctomycetota bacterium]
MQRSPRTVWYGVLAGLAFSVSGCLVMQQLGWRGGEEGFSHKLHVEVEEIECIDCHLYYEDEDEPGMPRLKGCMLCHEDIEAESPEAKRVETFFIDGEFNAALVNKLDPEIKFSHLAHVTDEEGCASCHAEIVNSEGRPGAWMGLNMDRCTSCHEAEQQPNDCSTCHEVLSTTTAPPSHGPAWDRQHGLNVRGGACPDSTESRCDLCHTESTCVQCHLEEAPENHNDFWRHRAHGLTARMDRQNCAACHEPDTCASCHASAQPQSHTALWGGSKNMHCIGCHDSGPQNFCQTCHSAGTPSHLLAPAKPPGHSAASDCRSCHTVIIHVDNGADCNQCHL